MLQKEIVNVDDIGLQSVQGRPDLMEEYHRHQGIELNFLERGSMTYLFAGTAQTVRAGCLAVFWAVYPHRLIEVDEETTFYFLHIPLPTFLQWGLPRNFTAFVLNGGIAVDNNEENAKIDRALFPRWHEEISSDIQDNNIVVFLELEARLRRLASDNTQPGTMETAVLNSRETLFVAKMTAFAAEYYTEDIAVADIAAHVGLHPKYAMKIFNNVMRLTIVAYVTQLRLSHAYRLLMTTDAKVIDIALASGFGSVNRFYAVFEQACGQSPTEFRKSRRAKRN